jgi:hypothetical protein
MERFEESFAGWPMVRISAWDLDLDVDVDLDEVVV